MPSPRLFANLFLFAFVSLNLLLPAESVRAGERARNVYCDICKARITGRYSIFTVNGQRRTVGEKCLNSGKRCVRCKIPIPKNGGDMCPSCQQTAPICSLCKKKISGNYTKTSNGEKFCKSCWALPKCGHCGLPMAKDDIHAKGGKFYHQRCLAAVKICSTCKKAITGTYFVHSFLDGFFCATCENTLPKCRVCSRPILTSEVVMIGTTKRPTCPTCAKTAVRTEAEIKAIFSECKKIIAAEIGESLYHEVPLTMIADISTIRQTKGLASAGKELGLFHRKGEAYRIYILYGLPRRMAYETLAHEWAHAWFAENGNRRQTQQTEEGFCQWVAAKVLKRKKLTRTLRILRERKDAMYGDGYRFIRQLEKDHGAKGVLEIVKNSPSPGIPLRPTK